MIYSFFVKEDYPRPQHQNDAHSHVTNQSRHQVCSLIQVRKSSLNIIKSSTTGKNRTRWLYTHAIVWPPFKPVVCIACYHFRTVALTSHMLLDFRTTEKRPHTDLSSCPVNDQPKNCDVLSAKNHVISTVPFKIHFISNREGRGLQFIWNQMQCLFIILHLYKP